MVCTCDLKSRLTRLLMCDKMVCVNRAYESSAAENDNFENPLSVIWIDLNSTISCQKSRPIYIYIYRKLKQKQKRINRKKSTYSPRRHFIIKWIRHEENIHSSERFQDLLLINVLMLSFVFCLLCFCYLLIHLSTLIYFNLVAELASDYFLNRKITPFFAGLCET